MQDLNTQIIYFTTDTVNTTIDSMISENVSYQASKKQLAMVVGEFIDYWGFRRIHGSVWTELYLSIDGLSGAEIAKRLNVSRALVSPALIELESYGLIVRADSLDDRSILFAAVDDVSSAIRNVLEKRENSMLEKISSTFQRFKSEAANQPSLPSHRLRNLEEMITLARFGLNFILDRGSLVDSFAFEKPNSD